MHWYLPATPAWRSFLKYALSLEPGTPVDYGLLDSLLSHAAAHSSPSPIRKARQEQVRVPTKGPQGHIEEREEPASEEAAAEEEVAETSASLCGVASSNEADGDEDDEGSGGWQESEGSGSGGEGTAATDGLLAECSDDESARGGEMSGSSGGPDTKRPRHHDS